MSERITYRIKLEVVRLRTPTGLPMVEYRGTDDLAMSTEMKANPVFAKAELTDTVLALIEEMFE